MNIRVCALAQVCPCTHASARLCDSAPPCNCLLSCLLCRYRLMMSMLEAVMMMLLVTLPSCVLAMCACPQPSWRKWSSGLPRPYPGRSPAQGGALAPPSPRRANRAFMGARVDQKRAKFGPSMSIQTWTCLAEAAQIGMNSDKMVEA